MEVTQAHLDLAATVLCERRLAAFVKEAWHVVEPGTDYVANWHIDGICKHLEAMTYEQVGYEEIEKLLINIPPGCCKSLLVSVFWPCWVWGPRNMPHTRWMFASYGEHLSVRDQLKRRDIISSKWFRERWGSRVTLRSDQDEKTRIGNTATGWWLATSVGGKATGEHPDYKIFDDPHNVKQAFSEQTRQHAITWWKETMSTRGMSRGAKCVGVMQRLHEDDLSGYIQENEENWEYIILPMRAEAGRMKPTRLGWIDPREEGELLWPDLFPEKSVLQLELNLGPYGTAGQLAQRPAPIGGGMLKREWFTPVDASPAEASRVRYWDRAGTENAGCYTAGVRMCVDNKGIFYIEDVRRDQLSMDRRDALILQTAQLDAAQFNNTVFIWHEEEPGSSGKDAATLLTRKLAAFPVASDKPKGDKVVRAQPLASQAAAGNVRIVKAPWNRDFLNEIEQFPNGKYKDQVDAASGAFNKLALGQFGGVLQDLNCSGGDADPNLHPLTEEEMVDCHPLLREIIEGGGGTVKRVDAYGNDDW